MLEKLEQLEKMEKQALSEIWLENLEKGTFLELEGWINWKTVFKLKISIAELPSLSFLDLRVSLKNFLVNPTMIGPPKITLDCFLCQRLPKMFFNPNFASLRTNRTKSPILF